MNISSLGFRSATIILILKVSSYKVGVRNNEICQCKAYHCNKQSGIKIRQHHSAETYTTAEYSNYLSIICHPGCKVDYSNKGKQWREKCGKVGYKVQVIFKNNCSYRSLFLHEIVDFFREIKNYGNPHYKAEGKHISTKKLLDYIDIDYFPIELNHSLRPSFSIMETFHSVKEPFNIWILDSLTSQR